MKKKLRRAQRYYEKGAEPQEQTIRGYLRNRDDTIVHGGRATNAFLPDYLDKPTEDWDILVPEEAEKVAKALEQLLDERYEGNYFEVRPSRHSGTFRVINRITSFPVADVTVTHYPVSFKKLADGINYATLDHHVQRIKATLQDPDKKFRWRKDREVLQRIEIHKEEQKQYDIGIEQLPETF